MPVQVTIGIPTAGRPKAIEACLDSIVANVRLDHRVIVLDSLVTDRARQAYGRYPNVECLGFTTPIGPSEARRRIADVSDSPYLLYLDDDNIVTPGSVEALLAFLEANPEVDIAAGGWREGGSLEKRALGQFFHFGRQNGRWGVYKSFVKIPDAQSMGLTSVRVDATLATMMIRRAVFERVSFDPRYDFFYELFDFFMQCRKEGVHIEAMPAVIFEHHPIPYEASTRRQTGEKSTDERRFAEKWGVEPIGRIGL